MSSAPETQVLSQALERAIGESRVRVAVFVAFQFDPAFFEHAILPLLFQRGFSDKEAVRRAQLDEALRDVEHVAVYYDRSGLVAEGGGARLDYRRIGVSLPGRVQHAKHVFVLVEDPGDPPTQRLVVLTTSANLTRTGWWMNVEVGHVHEIRAGQKDSIRQDLLGRGGLLSRLETLDRTATRDADVAMRDAPHAGLAAIRRFLDTQTSARGWSQQDGRWFPRLWHGEEPFVDFLGRYTDAGCKLEILAPFVDGVADAPTLRALVERLAPTATRILLPRDELGRVCCAEPFFAAVRAMPNVSWGQLPRGFTTFGKGKEQARERFVHAKVYRIFAPEDRIELLCVGSPNLTPAGHRGAKGGNLESAILFDRSGEQRPDWWLERIADVAGLEFHSMCAEDEAPTTVLPITLRFDWHTGTLSYFWDTVAPPTELELASGARPITSIAPVQAGAWINLPAELGPTLRDVLRSGAFLDVRAGSVDQRVLVQEIAMEHRPSLVCELSPEQILEYWSMLTPEQRDQFLERNVLSMVGSADEAPSLAERIDDVSMFDRFAGIFHAFSCLQERLAEALARCDASGERHAVYRLFGERHDSLGALVEKLVRETTRDRVNRYFGLLCALDVVKWVKREQRDFGSRHRDELRKLQRRIDLAAVRAEFTFGDAVERERFFGWLEEMFAKPVRIPEIQA